MMRRILLDAIEEIDRHLDEYAYVYTNTIREYIIEVREEMAALKDELDYILGTPAVRPTRTHEYD